MSKQELEETLQRVFSLIFQVAPESLSDESSPSTIPAWTSLQHLNLILALEEEFGISLTADDASRMVSFRTVRAIVAQRAEGK